LQTQSGASFARRFAQAKTLAAIAKSYGRLALNDLAVVAGPRHASLVIIASGRGLA
jgi:hypothetical protein